LKGEETSRSKIKEQRLGIGVREAEGIGKPERRRKVLPSSFGSKIANWFSNYLNGVEKVKNVNCIAGLLMILLCEGLNVNSLQYTGRCKRETQ